MHGRAESEPCAERRFRHGEIDLYPAPHGECSTAEAWRYARFGGSAVISGARSPEEALCGLAARLREKAQGLKRSADKYADPPFLTDAEQAEEHARAAEAWAEKLEAEQMGENRNGVYLRPVQDGWEASASTCVGRASEPELSLRQLAEKLDRQARIVRPMSAAGRVEEWAGIAREWAAALEAKK
jgi:hypothetical protein